MVEGFSVSVEHLDRGVSVVVLRGYLDAYTAPSLDELFEHLFKQGKHRLIVDCADLEYISSAGLGVFMGHVEPFRAAGGDIKFCSLSEQIAMIVETLGFQHIFQFYPHREHAYVAFEFNQQ